MELLSIDVRHCTYIVRLSFQRLEKKTDLPAFFLPDVQLTAHHIPDVSCSSCLNQLVGDPPSCCLTIAMFSYHWSCARWSDARWPLGLQYFAHLQFLDCSATSSCILWGPVDHILLQQLTLSADYAHHFFPTSYCVQWGLQLTAHQIQYSNCTTAYSVSWLCPPLFSYLILCSVRSSWRRIRSKMAAAAADSVSWLGPRGATLPRELNIFKIWRNFALFLSHFLNKTCRRKKFNLSVYWKKKNLGFETLPGGRLEEGVLSWIK